MPVLTFPNKHLNAVRDGSKTSTTRTTHTLHKAKPGDVAVLQFGARNNPTTLKTTITKVEDLDYLGFAEQVEASGDPRGELEAEELHAVIKASGTAYEKRLVEVAESEGQTVEGLANMLLDQQEEAVNAYAARKKLDPSKLSSSDVDMLFDKFKRRIVVLHFKQPG